MIMEVAIALENAADLPTGERKKEGDIITVRPTGTGIGTKEAKIYLWLRLEGLADRAAFDDLGSPLFEPDEATGLKYDKRRYCIPMERILIVEPTFDVDRARDEADLYQPFMVVDVEDFTYVTVDPPLQTSGLVYDKVIGDYL